MEVKVPDSPVLLVVRCVYFCALHLQRQQWLFLGSDPSSPTPSPQFACDEGALRRHVSTGVVRHKFSSPWLSGVLAIVQE